jgi:hypothetical protein
MPTPSFPPGLRTGWKSAREFDWIIWLIELRFTKGGGHSH